MLNPRQLSLSLATTMLPSLPCGLGCCPPAPGWGGRCSSQGARGSRVTVRPKASRPLTPSLSAAAPAARAASLSRPRLAAFYLILGLWQSTPASLWVRQLCLPPPQGHLLSSPRAPVGAFRSSNFGGRPRTRTARCFRQGLPLTLASERPLPPGGSCPPAQRHGATAHKVKDLF